MSNKRQLDRAALDELLKEAGVDPSSHTEVTELTEGTFNTVYRIGSDLILKLSPDPAASFMTYEQDLVHTEALFYQAARGKAPVPEVVHTGDDFLLMTALPGTTMQGVAGAERAALRRELGGVVAALHEVTGPGFGYPQKGLVATWSAAFLSMIDDVLADASRFAVDLPRPAEQIRQLVLARLDLLDEVQTPRLIHFDLWDGNILVEDGRITGLVDGERAFWGDPVTEFVSLTLFSSSMDPELLAGYGELEAGETLGLYRIYLYLIMLIEGTPRGYDGPDHQAMVKLILRHLNKELDHL
ncbi:aminoglycoside phosphotransferase family protein [Streptomyces sp. SID13031]|uniref:phosphotransferase family protein n=1 Tax=Streptomyces sp. SID13031 TaxID=2706046 RepID=UPI0013C92AD1|nr:aminoglycoside phosphotransferase family protein [Streptomyces sp. SID13031]NEA33882.1 aminoglycoside phosphotransferase family protein [Streptomyces sp. SID13031]